MLRLYTLIAFVFGFLFLTNVVSAQNFSFSCAKDTTIPGCSSTTCITLETIIPDISGLNSTTYSINPVSSAATSCFPVYANPDDPGRPTNISIDDRYSGVIDIGFPFPFYGQVYNQIVVSTNGVISFDVANAGLFAQWDILNAANVPQNIPNTFYDKAIIMGPYHDLDPSAGSSRNQLIQYTTVGVAPQRKWILSFYKVPLYSNNLASCTGLIENTHQIVLYEGTGIIEVLIFSKQICPGWNQGRAMVGIQDMSRTKAVMAPNRKATDPPWGSIGMNESWRFVPAGGTSLFKRVELTDMAGTTLATGTTASAGSGLLEASFDNVCPPPGVTTSYIVKSVYQSYDNPAEEIYGYDTVNVTKGPPGELNATATATATGCGPGTGTIIVTVPPGSGAAPYQFLVNGVLNNSGPSPDTIKGLPKGSYSISVLDGGGCSSLIRVNVPQTNNLSATTTNTATSCSGASNGTITVTPVNANTPLSYILDGLPPVAVSTIPFTITNVSSGIHSIIITEASGCTSVPLMVTVDVGPSITGSASTTPTTCLGASNGSITATANSGIAPWTYQLDSGPVLPGVNPFTFPNVTTGLHTLIITDAVGCNVMVPVNVPTGAALTAATSITATTCTGATNGSITITPNNGAAPFTFSLDAGVPLPGASPYTFSNLPGGLHSVTFIDAGGCQSAPIPVVITTGPPLTATTTIIGTSCTGASNGSVAITPSGGTSPFTFVFDISAPQSGTSPYTLANLPPGLHSVTFSDAGGCQSAAIPIVIPTGPPLAATTTIGATSCNAAANGNIVVTATNGTAPFTFTLDTGTPQLGTSPYTFSNVSSGSHTVVFGDAAGCVSQPIPIVVPTGPALTATISGIVPTTCNGALNGSFTITPASGGTAPYTFSLDSGPFVTITNPYTFSNLSSGNHTIIFGDAGGCQSAIIPVAIPTGPGLTTTVNKTNIVCNGNNNGTITVVQPAFGTPPFQYSLDNITWQGSNLFTGLAANTYTVYYRENNGCLGSQSVTITEPPILSAAITTTPVVCNGQANGIIKINTNGGVAPYQYSIDNGTTWQTNSSFNVAVGSYAIITKDANNCTVTQPAIVTQPPVLTATGVTTNATCNGGTDGTITVTAVGGNGNYQYSSDGVAFQVSNILNVKDGNFSVTVKDNLGCIYTFPATVGLTNTLVITHQTIDPTICEGKSTPLQAVSNAIQYAWRPATGLDNANIANPAASPSVTTQYIVGETLGNCYGEDTIIVNVNAAPIPDAGTPGFICYGQTYQLQGSGGVTFTWTPPIYLDDPAIADPVSTPSATTTYSLAVTDALGCNSLVNDNVTIDVTPPIHVSTFPADTVGYPGQQFQLLATSVANIYTWTPVNGLSNANIPNPIVTVGAIGADVIYKVTASTAAGCIGEGFVHVKVYTGPDIYMPTGFTPNNDGRNDKFTPFPVGIKQLNYFRVFNRAGQLVFFTSKLSNGWDGKFSGIDQPTGVYVWMVEGVTKEDKIINKKGTVVLIR